MMSEKDGESSLHKDIHNLDDSDQPHVNNENHYREVRVPDMKMRSNKVGNVTLINGIKRFRHTSNKRNLVLGSARTVSQGFDGTLISMSVSYTHLTLPTSD